MALQRRLEPALYHANLAKCYSSVAWGHAGLTFSFTVPELVCYKLLAISAPGTDGCVCLKLSETGEDWGGEEGGVTAEIKPSPFAVGLL
jgi:hypothetical protein